MKAAMVRGGAAVGASVVGAAGFVLPADAYLAGLALLFVVAASVVALSVQLTVPFVGLAVLVPTAVAFPFEFRGPAGILMSSSLPLTALVCAVWLGRIALRRDWRALDSSRVVYASLAFLSAAVLAFAMGQYPWFPGGGAPLPAQIAELGIFCLSVCLFLAVGHQIDRVQLKVLTALFVAAGLVTCLLQMQLHPSLLVVARWTSRPGSVGSLFWTWLVAVCLSQALFNRKLSPATAVLLAGMVGLVLYHGLFNARSWASGWVPPLVALCTILLIKFPRLSAGTALVVLPVALLFSGAISDALLGGEEYSLSTRQEAWRVLWPLVERSPLLGTGPANYYYFTENMPLLGWYVRFISHNNYQDLLVQTGFLGLLTFVWLAFEMFVMSARAYRGAADGFSRAYAAGAIGGLAGSLVAGMLGDWIIPFYYNAGILGFRSSLLLWVFLGGVLALARSGLPAGVPQHGRAHAPTRVTPQRGFVHA